jgi:geranylgeranyl transferase type-1 subunit beta
MEIRDIDGKVFASYIECFRSKHDPPSLMELNIESISNFLAFSITSILSEIQTRGIELANIAYFSLNGLAMIGKLDSVLSDERRAEIIDWVCSHQVGGFRSSACHSTPSHSVEESHGMMAYSSLMSLLLLGDDLGRVDTARILEGLRSLQLPSGASRSHPICFGSDIRFSFCAAAVTKVLGSTNGIDKAIDYIASCQTYEGGFGQHPLDEAHGGSTCCAIAALDRVPNRRMLAYWLSQRQSDGFNGRSHKLTDTCYSFWVGSPIKVLGWFDDIVNRESLSAFIFSNYCDNGQFRANWQSEPDLLHTHFSLSGLSLLEFPGIEPIHPSLGIVRKYLPDRILRRPNGGT